MDTGISNSNTQPRFKPPIAVGILAVISVILFFVFLTAYLRARHQYHDVILQTQQATMTKVQNILDTITKNTKSYSQQYATLVQKSPQSTAALRALSQKFLSQIPMKLAAVDIATLSQNHIENIDSVSKTPQKIDTKNVADLKALLAKQPSGWLPAFKSPTLHQYVIAYAVRQGNIITLFEFPTSVLQTLSEKYSVDINSIQSIIIFDGRTTQAIASTIKDFLFKKTLLEIAKQENLQENVKQLTEIMQGKKNQIQSFRLTTGNTIMIRRVNIAGTPWYVSFSYKKYPINPQYVAMHKWLNWLILISIIALFSLCYLGNRLLLGSSLSISWILSICFSIVCILCLSYFLIVSKEIQFYLSIQHNPPIINSQDYAKQINATDLNNITKYVPTGLQVFNMDVTDDKNVSMTGLVWQIFPLAKTVKTPDIYFVNQSDQAKFQPAYDDKVGENQVIGWWFKVALHEDLFNENIPFAYDHAYVNLLPKDFSENNEILVPAFDSYDQLMPENLPGLNKNITLTKYALKKSYYSATKTRLDFDFGIENPNLDQNESILTYNIILQRHILPIFMNYMFPGLIVMVMLFCYFTFFDMATIENATYDLIYVSSLLLTLTLSNTNFIDMLQLKHFTYLQFFYVTGYLAVIGVTLFVVLYYNKKSFAHLVIKENVSQIKLSFWPILTAAWLLITFGWFYV